MRPITIAGLQVELIRGNNVDVICREILLAKAIFPFIDMVVLAELAWHGVDLAAAEDLPGPTEARMQKVAKQAGVWLVGGSLFEKSGGKIYNTTPVIDPHGNVVARYRKIYPFLPYEAGVESGDRCTVFEVPGIGKFGLSICYDMWFPETIRQMTWMGADVILHPSLTYTIDREAEIAISRANAAMHQCYFLDINAVGLGGARSSVWGPGGELVHQAGVGREVVVVDLDLDHVARVRERGWHGLAQTIKSYRDTDIAYPVYAEGAKASPTFRDLGPMHFHKSRTWS